jgi:hypothetical protein
MVFVLFSTDVYFDSYYRGRGIVIVIVRWWLFCGGGGQQVMMHESKSQVSKLEGFRADR